MIYDDRTYSILVVSASDKFNELLSSVLAQGAEGMYSPVVRAESVTLAKRELLQRNFDMIIVNSPLPDEQGINFAIDSCRDKSCVCLLIVRNEIFDEIHAQVIGQGVFVLSKPLNAMILSRSVKWLESARERLRSLEKKASSVQEKMEEIRIVNRAKLVLIEKKGMSESEAHHFLEKQAMNNSVTRVSIAEKVIRLYQENA
ncbi:MAG: ANTAR domain-containing protein [Lachnospiraceae bacterium]|nr:ANTAR domain-containing protein [Lachnospiraceae bacterium]